MALRAKKEREEIDIKRKRKEGKVEELPDMYQNMYFLLCTLSPEQPPECFINIGC